MKQQLKKLHQAHRRGSDAFTIIEVLIVLAIAGLIMVVVFLAVPALQRNQRNEARNNDARLILTSVSECLANRNGVTASCDSLGGNEVNITVANLNQLNGSVSYGAGAGSLTTATWVFNVSCNADGTGTQPAGAREYAVRYQVESAGNNQPRCIDS